MTTLKKPKITKSILDHFGGNVPNRPVEPQEVCGAEKDCNNTRTSFGDLIQWADCNDNSFQACTSTTKNLPAGLYMLDLTERGLFFHKQKIETDDLLYFPGSELQEILDDINHFWGLSKVFKNYGFLHRRGYMLIGPAGCGKTCLVQLIMKSLIKQDGIIIDTQGNSPITIIRAIKQFRAIEPDRNIICLFEDIDAYVARYDESGLLSLLDGESQTNHVLNLASTNYPEKLDKRIVGRPRRFDRIRYIGYPNVEARKVFFENKLKINGDELKKYVTSTKDFTFTAMAELVISTKCFEKEFNQSIAEIKELLTHHHSSDDYYIKQVGFGK